MENASEKEIEWTEDALLEIGERYSGKPVFVRDFMIGIIKEDVETFAMMKAVNRIKTLGYHDLTFDAFDYAKENFKHIRDNVEAQERLDEIKDYVTSKGKIGLMDEEMLSKMKEILRK